MILLRTIIVFSLLLSGPVLVYAQEVTEEVAQEQDLEEEELEPEEAPPAPIDYSVYEELYGKNLKSVPFAVKYEYSKQKDLVWEEADVLERAHFIQEWETARSLEELEAYTLEAEAQQIAYEREMKRIAQKQTAEQKSYQRDLNKIKAKIESDQKKAEISNKVMAEKIKMMNLRQGHQ